MRYLQRVLDLTGGNKTQAAEILGIDRRTIDRMLAREPPAGRAAGAPATEAAPTDAERALDALTRAIEGAFTAARDIRALPLPPGVDAGAWRRALHRLGASVIGTQVGEREIAALLRRADG